MNQVLTDFTIPGIMICVVGNQTRSIIGARISDKAVRKDVRKLATWGAVVFISGFGIWNLDNALCGSLTQTKRALGMPWSFVLELHGWWHIFTGVGAYICEILFLEHCSLSCFELRCVDADS
jgi:dihydroceramidase